MRELIRTESVTLISNVEALALQTLKLQHAQTSDQTDDTSISQIHRLSGECLGEVEKFSSNKISESDRETTHLSKLGSPIKRKEDSNSPRVLKLVVFEGIGKIQQTFRKIAKIICKPKPVIAQILYKIDSLKQILEQYKPSFDEATNSSIPEFTRICKTIGDGTALVKSLCSEQEKYKASNKHEELLEELKKLLSNYATSRKATLRSMCSYNSVEDYLDSGYSTPTGAGGAGQTLTRPDRKASRTIIVEHLEESPGGEESSHQPRTPQSSEMSDDILLMRSSPSIDQPGGFFRLGNIGNPKHPLGNIDEIASSAEGDGSILGPHPLKPGPLSISNLKFYPNTLAPPSHPGATQSARLPSTQDPDPNPSPLPPVQITMKKQPDRGYTSAATNNNPAASEGQQRGWEDGLEKIGVMVRGNGEWEEKVLCVLKGDPLFDRIEKQKNGGMGIEELAGVVSALKKSHEELEKRHEAVLESLHQRVLELESENITLKKELQQSSRNNFRSPKMNLRLNTMEDDSGRLNMSAVTLGSEQKKPVQKKEARVPTHGYSKSLHVPSDELRLSVVSVNSNSNTPQNNASKKEESHSKAMITMSALNSMKTSTVSQNSEVSSSKNSQKAVLKTNTGMVVPPFLKPFFKSKPSNPTRVDASADHSIRTKTPSMSQSASHKQFKTAQSTELGNSIDKILGSSKLSKFNAQQSVKPQQKTDYAACVKSSIPIGQDEQLFKDCLLKHSGPLYSTPTLSIRYEKCTYSQDKDGLTVSADILIVAEWIYCGECANT